MKRLKTMRPLLKGRGVLVGMAAVMAVAVCVGAGIGVLVRLLVGVNGFVAVRLGVRAGVEVCAGIPPRLQAARVEIRNTEPTKFMVLFRLVLIC
jgi:hypothetical protein